MLTGQDLGAYVVGPKIGGGGMGVVYQAFPKVGGQAVALKVIHPEFAKDHQLQGRFSREIELMQSLNHEHIMPILDYGHQGDFLFLVMKLVNLNLAMLGQKRFFSPRDLWKILQPLCLALQYAHEHDVIHRDIKPSNVFLERQGDSFHVYLGDFGLGKHKDSLTLTYEGSQVGTPEYMSPEAILGDTLDLRADIYSLAVLVYEMLLGVYPIDVRQSKLNTIGQTTQPARPPKEVNPDFPLELQIVLMRGLEKERDLRYASVNSFAEEYYEALKAMGDSARRANYRMEH